jgi:hypothetical protein
MNMHLPLRQKFEALRRHFGSHTAAGRALGYRHSQSYRRARHLALDGAQEFPTHKLALMDYILRDQGLLDEPDVVSSGPIRQGAPFAAALRRGGNGSKAGAGPPESGASCTPGASAASLDPGETAAPGETRAAGEG